MNTRQAAEYVGLTYRQVDYALSQGALTPTAEYGQGKAREFSRRDLVFVRMFNLLRADRHNIQAIKQALTLLSEKWSEGNDPSKAGILYRLDQPKAEFVWYPTDDQLPPAPGASYTPGNFYYDVGTYAKEIYRSAPAESQLMYDKVPF